jgi:hypothetical protein
LLVPEEQLPMEELDLGGDLTQEIFHVSQLKKCLWVPEEKLPS